MPTALSVVGLAVLEDLETAYPKVPHLHDLSQSVRREIGRALLLQTADRLFARGLVEGRPFRGADGLNFLPPRYHPPCRSVERFPSLLPCKKASTCLARENAAARSLPPGMG